MLQKLPGHHDMPSTAPVRLSKLMAQRGLCSRREAERYIVQGMVTVDGQTISTLGSKIHPDQKIGLSRDALAHQSSLTTVLINKPPGYVSGLPEKGYRSAVTLITRRNAAHRKDPVPDRRGMAPAGRLDIDSSGLMVYTQDGRIARLLIGGRGEIEKEYVVRVNGEITDSALRQLGYGLSLDGRQLRRAEIVKLGDDQLKFVLREGRKRQIRRMCQMLGLEVTSLMRTRIGKIRLAGLPRGKWRLLDHGEQF